MKDKTSRKPKYHSEASTSWYLLGLALLVIVIFPIAYPIALLKSKMAKKERK